MCDPHRTSGFTLIELLCALAVILIAAALVLPGSGESEALRLRSAASLLVADLEYAQMQSIGNGIDPCVVVFDRVAGRYHLARTSDVATPIRDPGSGHPYVSRFGEGRASALRGVAFESLDLGGDDRLGFTASGSIDQGTKARIVLRAGAATIAVVVDEATGGIAIE